MNFRLKQQEIQAVQFVDGRVGEAIDFCPMLHVVFAWVQEVGKGHTPMRTVEVAGLATAQGDRKVSNGDWIVKAADGSCTVVTDLEFSKQYEAV